MILRVLVAEYLALIPGTDETMPYKSRIARDELASPAFLCEEIPANGNFAVTDLALYFVRRSLRAKSPPGCRYAPGRFAVLAGLAVSHRSEAETASHQDPKALARASSSSLWVCCMVGAFFHAASQSSRLAGASSTLAFTASKSICFRCSSFLCDDV